MKKYAFLVLLQVFSLSCDHKSPTNEMLDPVEVAKLAGKMPRITQAGDPIAHADCDLYRKGGDPTFVVKKENDSWVLYLECHNIYKIDTLKVLKKGTVSYHWGPSKEVGDIFDYHAGRVKEDGLHKIVNEVVDGAIIDRGLRACSHPWEQFDDGVRLTAIVAPEDLFLVNRFQMSRFEELWSNSSNEQPSVLAARGSHGLEKAGVHGYFEKHARLNRTFYNFINLKALTQIRPAVWDDIVAQDSEFLSSVNGNLDNSSLRQAILGLTLRLSQFNGLTHHEWFNKEYPSINRMLSGEKLTEADQAEWKPYSRAVVRRIGEIYQDLSERSDGEVLGPMVHSAFKYLPHDELEEELHLIDRLNKRKSQKLPPKIAEKVG